MSATGATTLSDGPAVSAISHIGSQVEKKLITAIVRSGDGQALLEKLVDTPGVLSVSHHHARGVGNRRGGRRRIFFNEKDVLLVLVEADRADEVFAWIYRAGHIGKPHVGMIFVERILRGHPMMPFGNADW